MCSNGANASHYNFLVLNRSSVPIQLWVNPRAGLPQKNPVWIPTREVWNLLHPSETLIPPHLAKHGPRYQAGSFAVSGNTCGAHVCWWPTQCSGGAPPFAYGTALALGLTETSLQSVELSEKDSSVTTFFNLNLQVKRNINWLFMSSPPTADWCRIQLKVALKCKVGVIICLKYFGSF